MWSRSHGGRGRDGGRAVTGPKRRIDDAGGGDDGLLKDAMRLELEIQQRRFFVRSLGDEHPLVRIQAIRAADARSRLTVREGLRTARDVAAAVDGDRKKEVVGLATRSRAVARAVDEFVDAVAEVRDEMEDFCGSFTSSEREEEA